MKILKFIHIPKTAGTSIEIIGELKGQKWGIKDTDTGYNKRHSLLPKHISCKNITDYDWFTVIRNPYTRIISTLNWVHKRYIQGRLKNHRFIKYYSELYKGYLQDKKILLNKYLFIALNNLDPKGGHFTPQYLYIDYDITLHILKFENLDIEFQNLMKKYNLNIKLNKKLNISSHFFNFNDLSKESILLINKIYYNDFKLFNYKIITS